MLASSARPRRLYQQPTRCAARTFDLHRRWAQRTQHASVVSSVRHAGSAAHSMTHGAHTERGIPSSQGGTEPGRAGGPHAHAAPSGGLNRRQTERKRCQKRMQHSDQTRARSRLAAEAAGQNQRQSPFALGGAAAARGRAGARTPAPNLLTHVGVEIRPSRRRDHRSTGLQRRRPAAALLPDTPQLCGAGLGEPPGARFTKPHMPQAAAPAGSAQLCRSRAAPRCCAPSTPRPACGKPRGFPAGRPAARAP